MILKNNNEIGFIYKKVLPKGYKRVEYIESTGTQYINTQYKANTNSKMWLDYQPTEAQSSMFAGARVSSSGYSFTINSGSNSTRMYASFGKSGNQTLSSMVTNRVQTQIGSDGIYYNNTKIYTPSGADLDDWEISGKVLLFACTQGASTVYLPSTVKIYGCKIWENDVLVRDFIPCQNNNVYGMFDVKNNQFYGNDGSGDFLGGNEVTDNSYNNIDKILCNNNVIFEQGFTRETSGVPPITTPTLSTGKNLRNYKIYGNSVQDGTPTTSNPVQIESVGNLITDINDVNYGKYKIPVTVSDGTNSNTTNIYLNEPLCKIGNYVNYIDFKNQKIIRDLGTLILKGNEDWTVSKNYSNVYQCKVNFNSVSIPICTHFVGLDASRTIGNVSDNTDTIKLETTSNNRIFVNMNSIGTTKTDLTNFLSQQYQNNTPVTVIYPLSTPTEEIINLPIIPSIKGTTIYSVGTEVQPSNMYIKYKGR